MAKRLKRFYLIESRPVGVDKGRPLTCWIVTKEAFAHLKDALPHLDTIDLKTARHHLTSVQVALQCRANGLEVRSERDLKSADKELCDLQGFREIQTASGMRRDQVMPDGSRVRRSEPGWLQDWITAWTPEHVADLAVTWPSHGRESEHRRQALIEVELTRKSDKRLRKKLYWYSQQHCEATVVYLCKTATIERAVREAAALVAPSLDLRTCVLPQSFLDAVTAHQGSPKGGLPLLTALLL